MSPAGRSVAAALSIGFLSCLLCCRDYPHGGAEVQEFEVKILSEAESVRTRLGERLTGYLAEYELDFAKHRVFLALEIHKYEKDERLTVKGVLAEDSVRIPYGDLPAADVPVLHVRKAAPVGPKTEVEKIISGTDKKR